MRIGIQKIEGENRQLDLMERNNQKLLATLEALMNDLSLDENSLELLSSPDFRSSGGVRKTLEAAQSLKSLLQPRLARTSGLESLTAVKEKREDLKNVCSGFCEKAFVFLVELFHSEAGEITELINSKSPNGESSSCLVPRNDSHDVLRRYQKLMDVLQTLDREIFVRIAIRYSEISSVPYQNEIKLFPAKFKKANLRDKVDRKMVNMHSVALPEPGEGKVISSHKSASSGQLQKTSFAGAFCELIEDISPSILAEQNFISDFFSITVDVSDINDLSKQSEAEEQHSSVLEESYREERMEELRNAEKQNRESLTRIMESSFKQIDVEINNLLSWGSETDAFLPLLVLKTTDTVLKEHEEESEYLIKFLTSIQSQARVLFNQYVEEQVSWIQDINVAAKKCGIGAPFLKLPAFLDLIEETCNMQMSEFDSHSPEASKSATVQTIGTTLQKIISATFKWIESIAVQDPKYTSVVLLTNFHFFWKTLESRPRRIPSLEKYVVDAKRLFEDNLDRYAKWHLQYAMPDPVQFWDALDSHLAGKTAPQDIPFTAGLSKNDLRALLKKHLDPKDVNKIVQEMLARVQKHFKGYPGLIKDIWTATRDHFISRYERFVKQISECYVNEKTPMSVSEVLHVFSAGESGALLAETSHSGQSRLTEIKE
jgi:hypothetical protein